MKHIVIVGGGFAGVATAIQLIRQLKQPVQLSLINPEPTFLTGVAYQPYATQLLLNVNAAKMSLFPDQPEHFLDWVMTLTAYAGMPRHFVAQAFLPRALYGEYLQQVWQQHQQLAQRKAVILRHIPGTITACKAQQQQFRLTLDNAQQLCADMVILANGNQLPGNKVLPDAGFAHSAFYLQNPWQALPETLLNKTKPVLILGNGLTMADTVLSLRQHGITQPVISLSRHGYTMLPHRHNGLTYPDFSSELLAATSLRQLVNIVHRHIRLVRQLGISAEPVIDAIRPYTQQLWRSLSDADKQRFLAKIRHLWGVARHRLPLHIHDHLQQLRLDGSLRVYAGKLVQLQQLTDGVQVQFIERKNRQLHRLEVAAVINCTGPETDLRHLPQHFMQQMLQDGLLQQDKFQLGIAADVNSFNVLDSNGQLQPALFTLGSNLRGELWESTAVNELRSQAQQLAAQLIKQLATG